MQVNPNGLQFSKQEVPASRHQPKRAEKLQEMLRFQTNHQFLQKILV